MSQSETRAIDLSIEVPGTPEEVWAMIATGPGMGSWFVPASVAEHEGGAVVLDMGSFGKPEGAVTAWEPPHRFAYDNDMEGGGLAFEWLVEARSGGTCVVRLVNSGFGAGAEWDAEFDGMTAGWRIFLENLRLQLTHFRGRTASRAILACGFAPGTQDEAWAALCDALGISAALQPGDRFSTVGSLAGSVATVLPWAYCVVVDGPVPGTGFLAAEGNTLSIWLYLHGDADDAWTGWLAERYPMTGVQ